MYSVSGLLLLQNSTVFKTPFVLKKDEHFKIFQHKAAAAYLTSFPQVVVNFKF